MSVHVCAVQTDTHTVRHTLILQTGLDYTNQSLVSRKDIFSECITLTLLHKNTHTYVQYIYISLSIDDKSIETSAACVVNMRLIFSKKGDDY